MANADGLPGMVYAIIWDALPHRGHHACVAEVPQGVGTYRRTDAGCIHAQLVRNKLAVRAYVDSHVAGVSERGRGDADVDLEGSTAPEEGHELREGVSAHERIVYEHDALAL